MSTESTGEATPTPSPAPRSLDEPVAADEITDEIQDAGQSIPPPASPPTQAPDPTPASTSASASPDEQGGRADIRMRTVVFGLVLLVIAGSVLVGQLTDVTVDAAGVLLTLMVGGGVLLIAGARRS